ncbi:MAG: RHS repeat-associated core domain-containing protein, partial [Bacteroidota bacterium]
MVHRASPVVQNDDYYPFGLTYNGWRRANKQANTLNTFQDQELVDELGLNWVQFKWRNHMPDIGRFFNVDPLAEDYVYNSVYAFSENNVVAHV